MNQSVGVDTQKNNFLTRVEKGMRVYDRAGHEVGDVDGIFMGAEVENVEDLGGQPAVLAAAVAPNTPAASIIPAVTPGPKGASDPTGLLPTEDAFPQVLRNRLLHDGFLRIDGGLLKHHRYILPDEIAAVDDGRVTLTVPEGALAKSSTKREE